MRLSSSTSSLCSSAFSFNRSDAADDGVCLEDAGVNSDMSKPLEKQFSKDAFLLLFSAPLDEAPDAPWTLR